MEFPAAGNYALVATISILEHNSTGGNNYTDIFTQTYPESQIYVGSYDVLATDRYNRINEVTSLALVGFAMIEGYKIIQDYVEKLGQHVAKM